jgi:hypothetical protein
MLTATIEGAMVCARATNATVKVFLTITGSFILYPNIP